MKSLERSRGCLKLAALVALASGLLTVPKAAFGQAVTIYFSTSSSNPLSNTVQASAGGTPSIYVWAVVTDTGVPDTEIGLSSLYFNGQSSQTLVGGKGAFSTGGTVGVQSYTPSTPFAGTGQVGTTGADANTDGILDLVSVSGKNGDASANSDNKTTTPAGAANAYEFGGNANGVDSWASLSTNAGQAAPGTNGTTGGWAWDIGTIAFNEGSSTTGFTGTTSFNPLVAAIKAQVTFNGGQTTTPAGGSTLSSVTYTSGGGVSFTAAPQGAPVPTNSLNGGTNAVRQMIGTTLSLPGSIGDSSGTASYVVTNITSTGSATLSGITPTSGTATTSTALPYSGTSDLTSAAAGSTFSYQTTSTDGTHTAASNTVVVQAIGNRVFNESLPPPTVRFINGTSVSLGSYGLTSSTLSSSATTVTIAAGPIGPSFGSQVGSVAVSGGVSSQKFDGNNTGGSLSLSTTSTPFVNTGTQTQSFTLNDSNGLSGESLNGENDSLSVNYNVDPVAKRSVTYTGGVTPVNLGSGLYWNGFGTINSPALAGSASISGAGTDDTTTAVNVALSNPADGNNVAGLSSGSTNGLFNQANTTGTRAIGGTLSLADIAGSHSLIAANNVVTGNVIYGVTTAEAGGNGLTGEGTYANVSVPYKFTTVGGSLAKGTGDGSFSDPSAAATAQVNLNSPYIGLAAQALGSASSGPGVEHSVAQILLGSNSGQFTGNAAANVGILYRNRTPNEAPHNDIVNGFPNGTPTDPPLAFGLPLVTDVARLYGMNSAEGATTTTTMQTDPFVLQMSFNPATMIAEGATPATLATRGNVYLASLLGSGASATWENTINADWSIDDSTSTTSNKTKDGSTIAVGIDAAAAMPNGSFKIPYIGSFASWENGPNGLGFLAGFKADGTNLADFVGDFGVDPINDQAWAIINHNSDFAVVPEPSSIVLAAFGVLAGLGAIRRKKNLVAA